MPLYIHHSMPTAKAKGTPTLIDLTNLLFDDFTIIFSPSPFACHLFFVLLQCKGKKYI
jgi:hypothetical protein